MLKIPMCEKKLRIRKKQIKENIRRKEIIKCQNLKRLYGFRLKIGLTLSLRICQSISSAKRHNKIINDIIYGKQDKKIKFSKGTIKVLIIAAVLLAIATTVFAIPPSREYIVDKFSNHSEYNVVDKKNSKSVTSLNVNYIPAGFEKSDDYGNTVQYVNGDKEFVVDKIELTASIGFDTEHYDPEIIKINGIDAVYYRSNYNGKGIIFNDGNYIYMIEGNIEKDELVQIAQNVE